ncbi:MAG TPA: hypothetical protein DCQ52_15340 [Acidimicrobiaceae bacterium]|nr:hypothetical protein [Acidimicrobiaceae bacterium]
MVLTDRSPAVSTTGRPALSWTPESRGLSSSASYNVWVMLNPKHSGVTEVTPGGHPSARAVGGCTNSTQRSTAEPARREYSHAVMAAPAASPTKTPTRMVARQW